MRPLGHGTTAAFGVPLHVYTEQNEAVKLWDNGHLLLGIYDDTVTPMKTAASK